MEEIVNAILRELHKLEYSESFVDLSTFTNKRDRDTRDNEIQRNPVAVSITTYESKAIEGQPKGKGCFLR